MSNESEEYGHDVEFIDEVPLELKCVICHLVLRDALQIMTCGHRFCSPCFNRIKKHAEQNTTELLCPVDRDVVDLGKVFEDRGIARTVGNLQTRCENQQRGCEWIGDLRNLQNHHSKCTYGVVEQFSRATLQGSNNELLLDDILMRLQKCEDNLIAKGERLEACESDLKLKEKQIAQLKLTIEEMKDDAKLRDQDVKLLKMSNLQLQNEISSLTEKNDDIEARAKLGFQNFMEKDEQFLAKVDELEMKVDLKLDTEKKQNESRAAENKIFDVSIFDKLNSYKIEMNALEKKLRALEDFKDDVADHIENLENCSFSCNSFYDGNKQDVKFQWVMTSYGKKFSTGNRVCSPLFSTSIDGYCFKLCVEWSGPRRGKLGLYLFLFRDKSYSKPLVPFNHEYTLEIMDRLGGKKTDIIDYEEIKAHPSSFQILNGHDTPKDLGCGSESLLTAPFDKYIINDSLFIACVIHM